MSVFEFQLLCSCVFNSILLALLTVFVFWKNPHNTLNRSFSFYTFSIFIWNFFSIFLIIASTKSDALFWDKLCLIGVVFIPSTFLHFTYIFIRRKVSKLIKSCYFLSIVFFILIFTDYFIKDVGPVFHLRYFTIPGVFYYPFIAFNISSIVYGTFLLWKNVKNSKNDYLRRQNIYLFWGTLIGYSGGSFNYNLVLRIPPYEIIPWLNLFISFYALIVAYAIVKYRLLDVKLVLTRATIFLFVYTLILGVPIWIGFKLLGIGIWLVPLLLMAVLATIGPFIYLFIQKRAEDALQQEQRRYQTTLRQASAGMGRIKDLKKLLNMIVYVLTRAVRLDHALVYINDNARKQYVLGASKQRVGHAQFNQRIENSAALVRYLSKSRLSLIYGEIKQRVQDSLDMDLIEIEKTMVSLEAELIIPIFVDQNLTAIVAMGKKESGKIYNDDDLSVFTILANQAALAIENAQFYEDMKKTQEQLFQAEKMATIGTMADGLSHQINNRFHALGFISGDALDTIKIVKEKGIPDNLKETFDDLERAFNRVQDNVVQGGEVVQGLLRYTRKGDAGFTAVDFEACFKSAFEMAQFKIKTNELKVMRTYDPGNIPKIKGNFTQLQEVFFNLIDNGYDAMMQRKNEQKEPGFQPTLTVHVHPLDGNEVEIIFEDNGAGVKGDDMHKLFTPFFTTKLSSKKGTGLGLYVIKKIVEENHKGKVDMVSNYMVGTQMKLRLPVAFE